MSFILPQDVNKCLMSYVLCLITRPLVPVLRLHKPVTDWLETLPQSITGLNM